MPDTVPTILLSGVVPAVVGAAAGGLVTWLLSPWVAEKEAEVVMRVQRPRLRGVFPGWGLRGPEVLVFNSGGRKTTVTDVGYYAADGSMGDALWAVYEDAADQPYEEHVDWLHPPQVRYLPKVVEDGEFIEIPLSPSNLAAVAFGNDDQPRRGLSGFWVKEADDTVTRISVDPPVLQGLLQWLPQPGAPPEPQ